VSGSRGRTRGDVDEVTVAVRVKPGAARTGVGGSYPGPHGPALIVAVQAPAVDGRATEAVRRALASALDVKSSQVALRAGATSRDKLFIVTAPYARVTARLQELRGGELRGDRGGPA
jgi:uncharacterized protein